MTAFALPTFFPASDASRVIFFSPSPAIFAEFDNWKESIKNAWDDIEITQENNLDNITLDAGNNIEVKCKVKLSNINKENIEAQVYYGRISENGTVDDITIIPMELEDSDEETRTYTKQK